ILLGEGSHFVKMEYFQHLHSAMAVLAWTTIPGGEVWHGEYFNNRDFSGAPTLFRDDVDLNFNWGGASPGLGIPGTNWSARWTARKTTHTAGYYTVTATSDDGVRVWIDGQAQLGAANIGVRPTVDKARQDPLLEVHVLDFSGDLYGHEVEVEFLFRLRDERKFDSLQALKEQLAQDVAEIRTRASEQSPER
ncbi:partial riboflavin kinase, partial [Planctomycetaceae bacterium]